jgi:hypothetical protein
MEIRKCLGVGTGAFLLGFAGITGCYANKLGLPPTDYELGSDGTDERKNGLYRKYEVILEGELVQRPGAPAQKPERGEMGVAVTPRAQAMAWSDEARTYLSRFIRPLAMEPRSALFGVAPFFRGAPSAWSPRRSLAPVSSPIRDPGP